MAKKIILPTPPPVGPKDETGSYLPLPVYPTLSAKLLNMGNSFPEQQAFTEDPSRFIDAQCSRRAGKTSGLAIRFFKTMELHPKTQCVYLSLTLDSARDIMWPVLQEFNDTHKLGYTFVESKLVMTHPTNGATLKLYGADMKNFIKRLKGRKFPGIAIDEAQDFSTHLQTLIDDVLTPATADFKDGWLALTGTPGPVPQGYFFEVTQNRRYGYSHHEWTILQNPHMPDPEKFIAELMAKREWDESNPTLLREYRNQWVLDVESLWIKYKEKLNHYETPPPSTQAKPLHYVLGIDIGYKDADALALLAWSYDSPVTYLIEEVITPKQGLTELVEQIQAIQKKYPITKMIIDEGGLGKKLAEEMRRRHGIPVHPADKVRKQENVELLNDAMRLSKFMAKKTSRFALDSYLVQIDWDHTTPNKIVVKKKPHSDIIDAVLYAFKESPAHAYQAPPKKPKAGSAEARDAVNQANWDEAMSHFQEQADLEKLISGN